MPTFQLSYIHDVPIGKLSDHLIRIVPLMTTELIMQNCSLCFRDPEEIKYALQQLVYFADLTILDLSMTGLDSQAKHLPKLFSALPAHINTLKLHGNNLGYILIDQLLAAFTAIPRTITTLDISGNGLIPFLSPENYERVLSVLPDSVTQICIDRTGFKPRGESPSGFRTPKDLCTYPAASPTSLSDLFFSKKTVPPLIPALSHCPEIVPILPMLSDLSK